MAREASRPPGIAEVVDPGTWLMTRTWFQFITGLWRRGDWYEVKFDASLFTANGSMTWTVEAADVTSFMWAGMSRTVFVNVVLAGTAVGGVVNTTLQVTLPQGFVAGRTAKLLGRAVNAGTAEVCVVEATSGSGTLAVKRLGGGNWTAGAVDVAFSVAIEVVG